MTAPFPMPSASAAELSVGPLVFMADAAGVLFEEAERILVVADLHLEKGSSFARRGRLLPPYDSRETLARLSAVLCRFKPRVFVSLGDALHDGEAMARIGAAEKDALEDCLAGAERIWVTGNHDPVTPGGLGGTSVPEIVIAGVTLRHEPSTDPAAWEIAGHIHPAAKLRRHGRAVRRRCFVSNGTRCVMPAFGAFAGGLNVLDPAFAPLFGRSFEARMLGEDRVYRVASSMLVPD